MLPASALKETRDRVGSGRSGQQAGAVGELATLVLDEQGLVSECSRASEALFGYRRGELVRRHVSLLLPQLGGIELVRDGRLNPRLHFLCRIGYPFQARTGTGESFAGNIFLNMLDCGGQARLSLIVRRAGEAAGDN